MTQFFVMNNKKNEDKIKELLQSRKKTKERLKKVKAIFQEEKENEESWLGHASSRYQTADSDLQVLLDHLSFIESELRKLGYKL